MARQMWVSTQFSCSSDIMKVLVVLFIFAAAALANPVSNLADLEFVHQYVEPNPRHTAEEWDAIYAAAENFVPEDTTGLVLGTTPQPEDAGKVFVEPADRIIAGSTASQGQFPWQAMLILGGSSLCGGSLITREWVLTAAHCLEGVSSYHVTLGSTSRTQTQAGSVSQNARQAVIHAGYNSATTVNDIGLLRLATDVTLSSHINVVKLPSSSEASKTFAGSAAIVSGFGRINGASNAVASSLMYANVEIIANTVCARTFGTKIIASNICSLGSGGRSPCNGDSGGPLVVHEGGSYVLVGAVSFGVANCPANSPAAYARITSFLSWISSHAGVAI